MTGPSPVLDTLIDAAVDATRAERGWLLAVTGDELQVVAGSGGDAACQVGARGPVAAGWAGAVVASRRPVALAPQGDDPRFLGDLVLGVGPRPVGLLCLPCPYDGGAVGAVQLVAGAPFVLDDVEVVTLLAEVAGAALIEMAREGATGIPDPVELGRELQRLAVADPSRYALVADVVGELLEG